MADLITYTVCYTLATYILYVLILGPCDNILFPVDYSPLFSSPKPDDTRWVMVSYPCAVFKQCAVDPVDHIIEVIEAMNDMDADVLL